MDFEYCSFIVRKDQDQAIFEGSAIPLAGMKGFDFEIELPLTTLDDLQATIDEYPVAASNGTNIFTAGLPPNIGSDLRIDYASGEGIYARDNSGAAVDNRATIAIYDFFSYFKVQDEVLYGYGAEGEVTEFYPSSWED